MGIVYILLVITLLVIVLAVVAFSWSVKTGQFEDLDTPAQRILWDDDDPRIPK